jgi:hypothetical protein
VDEWQVEHVAFLIPSDLSQFSAGVMFAQSNLQGSAFGSDFVPEAVFSREYDAMPVISRILQ